MLGLNDDLPRWMELKALLQSIFIMAIVVCGAAYAVQAQPYDQNRDTVSQVLYKPMFDRPIDPNSYLIRPGDRIRVTFLRMNLPALELPVSAEGTIVHPSVGVVNANGLTLTQIREKLKAPLAQQYNAKDIAITVAEPRLVTIAVTGAVGKPGHYRAFTSDQVSQVIALAGGVLPGGSTRFVKFSGGPKKLAADMDKAIYLGDESADPYLYSGMRIEVPVKSDQVVQVIGEVLQPREIELQQGDDLETLLALAGGLTRNADATKAQILGAPDRDPHQAGIIKAGDIIKVPAIGEGREDRVGIFGEIAAPGRYLLKDGASMEQLLALAGGVTSDANSERITVFRLAESDSWQVAMQERYAIDAPVNAKGTSLALRPFDSVFVPRKLGWVRVSGLVRAPGLVPYLDGKDALFYMNAAGGMVGNANSKEALVFNRVSRVASIVPVSTVVHDGDEVTVQAAEQIP